MFKHVALGFVYGEPTVSDTNYNKYSKHINSKYLSQAI